MIRARWDDWVNEARLRKLTEENKELAQNLKKDLDSQRRPAAPKPAVNSSKKKAAGSDLSSTRGSEERHSSVPAMGRGQKRGRDYEIEKVGSETSSLPSVYPRSAMSFPSASSHSTPYVSPTSCPSSSEPTIQGNDETTAETSPLVSPIFPNLRRKAKKDNGKASETVQPRLKLKRKNEASEDNIQKVVKKEPKASKEPKAPKEPKVPKELKAPKELKEPKEPKGIHDQSEEAQHHEEAISPSILPLTKVRSSPKRRKTSHQLESSISTRSSSTSEAHLTAEEILAAPLPREPRSRMLSQEAKGSTFRAKKPTKVHPQLRKLSAYDPCNSRKRSFFNDQHSSLKLMVAGVPKEGALHPNSCPSIASDPKISLSQFGAPSDDPKLEAEESLLAPKVNCKLQEETFHSRPAIRLLVPDNLKAILVDDWEHVTKDLMLVPLPSKTPVNLILDTYFEGEKGKRRLGSAEADLLEEVVAGMKMYFDKALGRILLYRFERQQFFETKQLWEAGTGEWEGKGPGDVYGAEHLSRLFGK